MILPRKIISLYHKWTKEERYLIYTAKMVLYKNGLNILISRYIY